jgi:hypothetical protein
MYEFNLETVNQIERPQLSSGGTGALCANTTWLLGCWGDALG